MWNNKNTFNGLSVLPYDGGTYKDAPFQTCTEEEYNNKFDKIENDNINLTEIIEDEDAPQSFFNYLFERLKQVLTKQHHGGILIGAISPRLFFGTLLVFFVGYLGVEFWKWKKKNSPSSQEPPLALKSWLSRLSQRPSIPDRWTTSRWGRMSLARLGQSGTASYETARSYLFKIAA
jgi:hypothetical protein